MRVQERQRQRRWRPSVIGADRPRAIGGTEDGIVRNETGVHVQLQYSISMSRQATLVLHQSRIADVGNVEVRDELIVEAIK